MCHIFSYLPLVHSAKLKLKYRLNRSIFHYFTLILFYVAWREDSTYEKHCSIKNTTRTSCAMNMQHWNCKKAWYFDMEIKFGRRSVDKIYYCSTHVTKNWLKQSHSIYYSRTYDVPLTESLIFLLLKRNKNALGRQARTWCFPRFAGTKQWGNASER